MLELPECHTLARQLDETVLGRKVVRVTANASPHRFAFFLGDPAGYPALLAGRTVDAARALGGMVELSLGPQRLLLGDGVNLRYLAAGAPRPAKTQLVLELSQGDALVCTVQMYGGMWAFPAGEFESPYYQAALEAPSPLGPAFSLPHFLRLFEGIAPSLSVKGLLATEQRIPGLGNGVLQDILFAARLHPKAKAAALDAPARERLHRAVTDTLRAMAGAGGRDTERDLFGNPGGYRTLLSKNTLRNPCPVCGGPIQRQAYLGGSVYFCPRCQPLG